MRITAFITVSAERTLTRFLNPNLDKLADVSPEGKFDESKARQALADVHGVTLSSGDRAPEYAFALRFIDYAHEIMRQLAEKPGSGDHATCKLDQQAERKMNRGKCGYARIDVKWCTDHIRVRVEGANPLELVGQVETQIRETCVFFAYVCLLMKRNLSAGANIEIVEGPFADGAVERAAEKMREGELYRKGAACPNRVGGYCSPSDPTCGNYCGGRCKWEPER